MDNANELKEALDFLSPSALTYDEWILVGMGLKEAGLPVEAWEQWSARDGGRYHKGECAKKWASFHGGGGSPVTASSWPIPANGEALPAMHWTGTTTSPPGRTTQTASW